MEDSSCESPTIHMDELPVKVEWLTTVVDRATGLPARLLAADGTLTLAAPPPTGDRQFEVVWSGSTKRRGRLSKGELLAPYKTKGSGIWDKIRDGLSLRPDRRNPGPKPNAG
jgi:hypothetical protein